MKFTYTWLKEHLDTSATPAEIGDKLTAIGLEVDAFTDLGKKYAPFIIAQIKDAVKHPNADKLRVCSVDNGSETLQIVCGAANARAGIKVVLAPVGALIPNGNFQIKKSKIRDVESNGMLCSAEELELSGDSDGIIELPADAPVGKAYAEYAGMNDSLYEINITPNRADCLGVRGIARDLAAAGMGKLKELRVESRESSVRSPITVNSSHYYIGRYFSGVKNGASPDWLASRLKSIGLTPISALVDITNYFTFNFGRPLHVYDADKLKGNLVVRVQSSESSFNALNNKTYLLKNDLVIADDNGPVALAGVIGNIESSVDENTKNVFLEVAYFDPADVAASGRKHQIDSDARYRFERGVDCEFMAEAAEWATKFIINICGGNASEVITAGKKPSWQREIKFDFAKTKSFGGIDISKADATKILENLGFTITSLRGGNADAAIHAGGASDSGLLRSTRNDEVAITPPSWRGDIEGEADIVEEILRIHGYDKVPAQVLPFKGAASLPQFVINLSNARRNLTNRGFIETTTYSFLEPKTASLFGGGNAALNLQNPISTELAEMRPSILPNLISAATRNSNRGFKNFSLFEIGPIFTDKEITAIAGIRVGATSGKTIYGKPREWDVFDVKADLLAITGDMGEIREGAPTHFHPGRSGGLYLGKTCLGYFGEIHPAILKKLDLELGTVGFEILSDNIPLSNRKFKKFEATDLQEVTRDFAFVLPNPSKAGDIAPKARKADKLISNVTIFDLYEGANLGEGKKSIAFTITITPQEKTLTDTEIETISQKVIHIIKTELGGELRA